MIDQKEIRLVFEGSSVDAGFVTNILEDSGVSTLVKNKTLGSLYPHYASHGGVHPVKIFVKKSDYQNACGIIETYIQGNNDSTESKSDK